MAVKKIGFVGLGAMGLPMARNLAKSQFNVRGFDLRPGAAATLIEVGGESADSAAAACAGADAVMLMVVSLPQAESVLFDAGALDALAPGAVVIVSATCPPEGVVTLARRVEATGRLFVDAPVSGGVVGAESGSLTIMASGSDAAFELAMPVLNKVGGKIVRVGSEPGQGATAKAVNQLMCGVHIAVAAEALSLAEKLGLDMDAMFDIVSGSAAGSWMLSNRGPRMLQADPPVTSAVDIFVKDLTIVLEAGHGAKTALPLAAVAHQLFLSVSGRGLGAIDDSQVIRAYRSLQGRE
ncbi:MAG: NAD(P)-dependent oxidoreductase [Acetobacteraceae bacterium]|nr:NAD(P)-dependent oxidoreductase [Acetobacteraceae bacterium]